MFQSFDSQASSEQSGARIAALREALARLGIDGFLVPRADDFQGEYVPASAERLAWLTGFTGSAGVALVTAAEAVVFVDGRYVTQLGEQADMAVVTHGDLVGEPPHAWLEKHAKDGFVLGIDPWLHTASELAKLEKALAAKGGRVTVLERNPLDAIWSDRPAEPLGRVRIHDIAEAGRLASDKLKALAADIAAAGHTAFVLTDPSSVAWAFNLRGSDVPHTPHPLARAILHADGNAEIFLDKRKTGIGEEAYLAQIATQLAPSELAARLGAIAAAGGAIALDPDLAPVALSSLIREKGGRVSEMADPVRLPRACKNDTELAGMRAAHLQDGAAMVEFLAWLDAQRPEGLTEISVATALEQARASVGERMQNRLRDLSFDTISGAGENAAIIHYRVTHKTDRPLRAGEMMLIDSGAQYLNGTTDITRTIAIGGAVPEEQRRFFTLVLKGMIAISVARFPKGTRGLDLDPLARVALWKAGADYAHGTGHGVGSYLSVHEGPQRISRLAAQELLPGMVLSNEPGYYRPGSFGIRIENLLVVTADEAIAGGETPMRGFETLTFCPIDRRLVVESLLTREEIAWLDAYHAETRVKLMPLIDGDAARAWLERATAPFA